MTQFFSFFVLLNLIILNPGSAATQTQHTTDSIEINSLKQEIKQKLERLESDASEKTPAQETIKELYQATLFRIEDYQNSKLKIGTFRELKANINQELRKIERSISAITQSTPDLKSQDIDQLNKRIKELETTLLEKQTTVNNIVQQKQLKLNRPLQIQLEKQDLTEQLVSAKKNLEQLNPGSQPDFEQFYAKQQLLRSIVFSLQEKLSELNQELSIHPDSIALLQKRLELSSTEIESFKSEIKFLRKRVAEIREQHSIKFTQLMSDSLTKSDQFHPLLNEIVQINLNLNGEYADLLDTINQIDKYTQQLDAEQQSIKTRTEKASKLLALSEISPSLAAALRQQRFNLNKFLKNLEFKIGQLISREKASLRQFELQDSLEETHDLDRFIHEELQHHGVETSSSESITMSGQLRLLMTEQHKLLMDLESAYSEYINKFDALDLKRQLLESHIAAFTELLDTHLLWVRTASPINAGFIDNLMLSFEWFLSPDNWKTLSDQLIEGIYKHHLITTVLGVFMIIYILFRSSIIQKSHDINRLASNFRTDHIGLTAVSLLILVMRVLPLVIVTFYFSWILKKTADENSFVMDISAGLQGICLPLFFLQVFYLFFSSDGIAAKHLRWPKQSITVLRRQLKWVRFVALPCLFLVVITQSSNTLRYSDSLGRAALIMMTWVMSIVLYQSAHPVKGALKRFFDNHSNSLLYKLRYLLFVLIVVFPLIIGVFSAAGYLASAFELQMRTLNTFRLFVVAVIIYSIALRGLRLFNVNIAIKKYQEKKSTEKTTKGQVKEQENKLPLDLDSVDIAAINQQTRRLVSFLVVIAFTIGLWLVWRDLVPALAITDEFVLWTNSSVIDEKKITVTITLANLLTALFYLIVGLFASRNLPGLLEVLFLNRFVLQPGTRYATIQLLNYLVVGIVIFCVFKELGAEWSQIQWLIAALGVGLGFGLQEIFANMISGLILLFERPIRIGDTVTVGDISGTVSKIQIRATTITDWDKKELLVPNKNFITDQLVNWTLTDTTTRLIIKVGVAYGSNTQLVHQTLLDIAKSHPQVVKDPAPTVLFTEFADSSLNFEVRVYVQEIFIRLDVKHDLNSAIDQKFRELNITIPFPQRDVHLFQTTKES